MDLSSACLIRKQSLPSPLSDLEFTAYHDKLPLARPAGHSLGAPLVLSDQIRVSTMSSVLLTKWELGKGEQSANPEHVLKAIKDGPCWRTRTQCSESRESVCIGGHRIVASISGQPVHTLSPSMHAPQILPWSTKKVVEMNCRSCGAHKKNVGSKCHGHGEDDTFILLSENSTLGKRAVT